MFHQDCESLIPFSQRRQLYEASGTSTAIQATNNTKARTCIFTEIYGWRQTLHLVKRTLYGDKKNAGKKAHQMQ